MKYYLLAFYKPRAAFENLLTDKRFFKLSFLYILIPITAYTLIYIFLNIAHGAPSTFTPWLNIPKENYYAVNRFLLAPSLLLCWLSASAVMQISARLAGGKGGFEQSFALLALSISVAMWGGLIHDLPMSFCSAIGVVDARRHEIAMNSATIYRTLLWLAYSVYFVAFLLLFTLSVKVAHKLNWLVCFCVGVLSFGVFQIIFLLFNR